ncbi:MAG: VWA domain-containing protein [Actinomycetota bacterium]
MRFHWPNLLWLLLLLPLLVAAYLAQERLRARGAERFARPAMLPNVVPRHPSWRRHLPFALMLVAIGLLLIGFARPERMEQVPRERATIMLVLDASNSMNAEDVEPNRLAAARSAVRTLIRQLPPKFRVGIVTFGRSAQVLSAPTIDREAAHQALDAIDTTQGTVLGDGMVRGLEAAPALAEGEPMVMLVLSDGNDTGSEVAPPEAAIRASEAGVRVNTVLMGTEAGDPTRGLRGANEQVLRDVATATGGRFFAAGDAGGLDSIYRSIGVRISRVTEVRELAYAFVGGAAFIAVLAAALGGLWFRRMP